MHKFYTGYLIVRQMEGVKYLQYGNVYNTFTCLDLRLELCVCVCECVTPTLHLL